MDHDVNAMFVNAVFAITVILNGYKFFPMLAVPYNIFPWSPTVNTSHSLPIWLACHNLTAILLAYFSRSWFVNQANPFTFSIGRGNRSCCRDPFTEGSQHRNTIFCHLVFVLLILCNPFRLGPMHSTNAFFVNIITTTILTVLLIKKQPFFYFMLLNAPVFVEMFSLFSHCYENRN